MQALLAMTVIAAVGGAAFFYMSNLGAYIVKHAKLSYLISSPGRFGLQCGRASVTWLVRVGFWGASGVLLGFAVLGRLAGIAGEISAHLAAKRSVNGNPTDGTIHPPHQPSPGSIPACTDFRSRELNLEKNDLAQMAPYNIRPRSRPNMMKCSVGRHTVTTKTLTICSLCAWGGGLHGLRIRPIGGAGQGPNSGCSACGPRRRRCVPRHRRAPP